MRDAALAKSSSPVAAVGSSVKPGMEHGVKSEGRGMAGSVTHLVPLDKVGLVLSHDLQLRAAGGPVLVDLHHEVGVQDEQHRGVGEGGQAGL